MGRGRKRKQQQVDGNGAQPAPKVKGQQHHGEGIPDPPTAVLAVRPDGAAVAVAVGPEIRVYDAKAQEVKVLRQKPEQVAEGDANKLYIRSLDFDSAGNFLVAGCDDKSKAVLLWDCGAWQQLQAVKLPKRVSTVTFTSDGAYMLAADKFGDVHVAATKPAGSGTPGVELLLGHYNAVLTSVRVSPCGKFVVTTDREKKARVSILPPNPLAGAHEIQSYCLGHTDFVTCSAFASQGNKELLVTGGADGTLRLWDHLDGSLLATLDLYLQRQQQQGEEQGEQQQQGEGEAHAAAQAEQQGSGAAEAEAGVGGGGGEEEGEGEGEEGEGGEGSGRANDAIPAVISFAVSPDGRWVACLLEDRDEVALVGVDFEGRQLQEPKWQAMEGLHMPTQLAFGPGNRLWAVGGPPTDASVAGYLACADVGADGTLTEPADWLPAAARAALQAHDGSESAALAAANEARQARRSARMEALRRGRAYTQEEMQRRKMQRRDVRAKEQRAQKEQAQQQAQQAQQQEQQA